MKIKIGHIIFAKGRVLAALLVLLAVPIHADVSWQGLSGDYNTAANWVGLGSKPPDAMTVAIIDKNIIATINANSFAGGLTIGTTTLGAGATLTIAGAFTLANSGSASIGNADAGSVGTVNVNGGTWTNTGILTVGNAGTGTLAINAGSTVSDSAGVIGVASGSNGFVTVDGGTWTNTGALGLAVGSSGTGSLQILNGGRVTSVSGKVGNQSVNNAVTIDGTGSMWTSNAVTVGLNSGGTGTLTLKNSGQLNLNSGNGTLTLASNAGSQGNLNIGSPGATAGTLLASGIQVGSGTANVVFNHITPNYIFVPISGSGKVSIDHIGMGATDLTGNNNCNQGFVTVDGGILQIQNGATVSDISLRIGQAGGSNSNGWVKVNGAGSNWNNTSTVIVGGSGSGKLDILNGGIVTSGFGGGIVGSAGNGTVTVDGLNSKWDAGSESLTIGLNGIGTLNINNGGTVISATGDIAKNAGSSGSVTIDGNGSRWTVNNASFAIGSAGGNGSLTLQNDGELNLGAAATLSLTCNASNLNSTLNIGNGSNNAPGKLVASKVNNIGSGTAELAFNHNSNNYVFDPSVSGNIAVKVKNGTTIFTTNNNYTSGTNIIGGRLYANNATGSATGSGNVTVSAGGILSGNGIIHGNTIIYGTLAPDGVDDLIFETNLALDKDSSTVITIDTVNQYDKIVVGGTFMMDGTLVVQFSNNYIPAFGDSFHIFDWFAQNAAWDIGTFSNGVNLPDLNSAVTSLSWDLSTLSTLGTLTIIPEPSTWVLLLIGLAGVSFSIIRYRAGTAGSTVGQNS